MISFVYDMATHKVGCALLQAAYGTSLNSFDLQRFGVDNWVLAPTDTLRVYTVDTKEQLDMVIDICHKHNQKEDDKET